MGSGQVGAIGGKFGELVRTPFKGLDAADQFFKHLSAAQEAYRIAFRKTYDPKFGGGQSLAREARMKLTADLASEMLRAIKQPDVHSELYEKWAPQIEQITKTAERDTFQTPLEKFGRSIQSLTRNHPILQAVLPFTSTPGNIAKEAAYRTPLAFAFKQFRQKLAGFKAGDAKAGEAAEELSKMLVGSAMGAIAIGAAYKGLLTG